MVDTYDSNNDSNRYEGPYDHDASRMTHKKIVDERSSLARAVIRNDPFESSYKLYGQDDGPTDFSTCADLSEQFAKALPKYNVYGEFIFSDMFGDTTPTCNIIAHHKKWSRRS